MSDIQSAFEFPSYPLAHFDTWLKVARNLVHFWTAFSDEDFVKSTDLREIKDQVDSHIQRIKEAHLIQKKTGRA